MQNGNCPKCGSQEVFRMDGNRQSAQELVTLRGGVFSNGDAPHKYLCTSCGYLEYYLPLTDENLQMVKENWVRVSPR